MGMAELTKEERARQSKAIRQKKWREKRAKKSKRPNADTAAVQLNNTECGVLDTIAKGIYLANPHDPRKQIVSHVVPGRSAAIRWLIEEHRKKLLASSVRGHRKPAPRDAMSAFWVAEAAWRQARKENTKAEPPAPPWRD
jgi:hypothetical protein